MWRFVLLGGAHGFDGSDDVDNGSFLAELLRRFEDRVGAANVVKMTLSEDAGAAHIPDICVAGLLHANLSDDVRS